MKKIEVEVLSEEINSPVIQLMGRRFPGVVIQGDSLKNLHTLSEEIIRLANETSATDLKETALELKELLAGYVNNYEAVVRNCGRDLPYPT